MDTAIGIDIGGTKIDFVLVDRKGNILADYRTATASEEGFAAVVNRLRVGIEHLTAQREVTVGGVGIGCAGQVNPITGTIQRAVNLGWESVNMRQGLGEFIDYPIYLENDVNALALGEVQFGVAKGVKNLAYLAIGTGLGGAAIMNGKLLNGANAFAMEIGHLSLDMKGRRCRCGQYGCIECYISGIGFLNGLAEHQPNYPDETIEADTSLILQAAQQGSPLANAVLQEAAHWLGRAIACCAGLLNPSHVFIGGGLGIAAFDQLVPIAQTYLPHYVLPESYAGVQILSPTIQRAAIGAASLVFEEQV